MHCAQLDGIALHVRTVNAFVMEVNVHLCMPRCHLLCGSPKHALAIQIDVQLAKEHGYNNVAASRTFTCTSIW